MPYLKGELVCVGDLWLDDETEKLNYCIKKKNLRTLMGFPDEEAPWFQSQSIRHIRSLNMFLFFIFSQSVMIDYYEVQVLWIKEQPTVVLMVVLVHHQSLCSQ